MTDEQQTSNNSNNSMLNIKDTARLMPKTVNELKEIQARGRKMLIKTKYIKRSNSAKSQAREETKEELEELRKQKEQDIKAAKPLITYSSHYDDDTYEYRHVMLPKTLVKWLPPGLLKPTQWMEFGVQQPASWEHYMVYAPEPHILLFRRNKEYRKKRLQAQQESSSKQTEAINDEDISIATNISDIPPLSRNNLHSYRTRLPK